MEVAEKEKKVHLEALRPEVAEAFQALQQVITRAAIGAARTAQRLERIGQQFTEARTGVETATRAVQQIRQRVEAVAEAARSTADVAHQVTQLTEEGRQQSAASQQAVEHLEQQVAAVMERLERLVAQVQGITQISDVIDRIAWKTKLLAFNAGIEAARAGHEGQGFSVLANEIKTLSEDTALQTRQIRTLINDLVKELQPVEEAITQSQKLLHATVEQSDRLEAALQRIHELAEQAARHMDRVVTTVDAQLQDAETVGATLQQALTAVGHVDEDARHIAHDTFMLSELVVDAYGYLGRFEGRSLFHRALQLARELAERSRRIFEQVIDEGRCTLDDVLALEYTEIKGREAIASLARLFDVSRVPESGFDPPKYSTRYDHLVDEALQQVMDEILEREPRLTFALVLDLNTYAPAHNRRFCQDWTGDPQKDLVGNRVKRFFFDKGVLVRGARVGLPEAAVQLPNRARREDFLRVCDLRERPEERDVFLVQTYARDTGQVLTVLTVPLYVKGHRYGAVELGWDPERVGG